MISWKNPDASTQGIAFEDYVTDGPLTASDAVREIIGTQLRVGWQKRRLPRKNAWK
jgi:poly(3-hydroxyalkanoate) synthetase